MRDKKLQPDALIEDFLLGKVSCETGSDSLDHRYGANAG